MNAIAFHAARSSGHRVQSGARVAPYLVTLGIEEDYPEVGKRGGRYKVVNGKKVYAPKGGGGGTRKPAAAPKAQRGKKGKVPVVNSQQVRPDGTGGPAGPNRKPTPEERAGSARAKAKFPPPFKGPAAVKKVTEDLEKFLSAAPANREKMVAEYVQVFQDMVASGDDKALSAASESLWSSWEPPDRGLPLAQQITPEKVRAFIQGVAKEFQEMKSNVKAVFDEEDKKDAQMRFRLGQWALEEFRAKARQNSNKMARAIKDRWEGENKKAPLFEQILKFKW